MWGKLSIWLIPLCGAAPRREEKEKEVLGINSLRSKRMPHFAWDHRAWEENSGISSSPSSVLRGWKRVINLFLEGQLSPQKEVRNHNQAALCVPAPTGMHDVGQVVFFLEPLLPHLQSGGDLFSPLDGYEDTKSGHTLSILFSCHCPWACQKSLGFMSSSQRRMYVMGCQFQDKSLIWVSVPHGSWSLHL